MHESSLIPDLMEKINQVALDNGAQKVTAVELVIGAMAGISPDHLREHFDEAAMGTSAQGAELRISVADDPLSEDAFAIRLLAVEVDT
ncbi:MAG TPA: hydrogenase maturation nickel metallochaperone HypA [Bryobacteraceae bacterium]|nr:hydrogenase maturation nickel metallochaperone HypA [Bryobacteraceae bacterium]